LPRRANWSSFELELKGHVLLFRTRRGLPKQDRASRNGGASLPVSTFCTLLSFQRPDRWAGDKKASARARGLREGTTNSYPLARRRSSCRVTGFLCPPLGRPKDGSTPLSAVNEAVPGPRGQLVKRTNRRLPACTSAPMSRARGMSSSSTTSPSTFTPPCAMRRRASLVESPKQSASTAGR